MKVPATLFLGAALLIQLSGALLATDARQQQHEVMRDALTRDRVADADEPMVYEDDEFGEQLILQRIPPPPSFTVFADGGTSYSSNPLLLPDGSRGEFLFTGTAGALFRPQIVREWEPALELEFFAQYQLFRYERESVLDFDGQSAGFQASYALPRDWRVYGGWTGSQLEDREGNDRFYRESQSTLGLRKVRHEGRKFATFAGLQADLRHTTPSDLSRVDYGPYAGFRVLLHEKLPLTARYRLAHQHYLQNNRDDFNSWLNLSMSWKIRPALTLQLQTNYVANRSNREENDYNLVTSRFGGSLSYSF